MGTKTKRRKCFFFLIFWRERERERERERGVQKSQR